MKPLQAVILAVSVVVLLLGGLVVLRFYIPLSNYDVASASMAPTLRIGEQVLTNAERGRCRIKDPKSGQVAVIKSDRYRIIKRLIADGGHTIEMRDGLLSIDGAPVRMKVLGPNTADDIGGTLQRETLPNGVAYEVLDLGPHGMVDNFGPVTVPAGHWFVMGDNRDNSADSRIGPEMGGPGMVAIENLCGQVTSILISPDPKRQGLKP